MSRPTYINPKNTPEAGFGLEIEPGGMNIDFMGDFIDRTIGDIKSASGVGTVTAIGRLSRVSLAPAMSTIALTGSAVASLEAVSLSGITSEPTHAFAQSSPPNSICTTPTNEVPTSQPPSGNSYDIAIDKMAFSNPFCAGQTTVVSTNIRNYGTDDPNGIRIGITGREDIVHNINSVSINGENIPIKPAGYDAKKYERVCVQDFSNTDRVGHEAITILCGYNFYIDLPPSSNVSLQANVLPNKATPIFTKFNPTNYTNPYLQVYAFGASEEPGNKKNNITTRDLEVFKSDGTSASKTQSQPNVDPGKEQKGPSDKNGLDMKLKQSKGRLVVTLANHTKFNILGIGNGASKESKKRSKAARFVIISKTLSTKLAKNMLKVGNRLYVDVPAKGIPSNKLYTFVVRTTDIGPIKSIFYAPTGTLKDAKISLKQIKSSR